MHIIIIVKRAEVCRYGSGHYIRFQQEIVKDIEEIVSGDYKGTGTVQVSTPHSPGVLWRFRIFCISLVFCLQLL